MRDPQPTTANETGVVTGKRPSSQKAVVLGEATSASSCRPSEPSVHVDSMAVSLLGVALVMVLVAACAAGFHAERAGDEGRCSGELHWAAHAIVSTG